MLLTDWLVVPGSRLGGVHLLQEERRAVAPLGKASGGEGAAGHHWTTWIGQGGGRLDVYASLRRGTDRPQVVEVRATSPRFRLRNGLRTDLPAERFCKRYPSAKKVATYVSAAGRVDLWDSVRQGLAWEAANGRVLALIVHPKGERLRGLTGPYQRTVPVAR